MNHALEDKRLWLPDSSHIFSCKYAFNKLRETLNTNVFSPFKLIWKSTIPHKTKVFAWLVALGRVNTCDVLQRKRLIVRCILAGVYCVKEKRKLSIICLFTVALAHESSGKYCRFLVCIGWFLDHVMGCFQVRQVSSKEMRKKLFSISSCLQHCGQFGVIETIEYLKDVLLQKMICGRKSVFGWPFG